MKSSKIKSLVLLFAAGLFSLNSCQKTEQIQPKQENNSIVYKNYQENGIDTEQLKDLSEQDLNILTEYVSSIENAEKPADVNTSNEKSSYIYLAQGQKINFSIQANNSSNNSGVYAFSGQRYKITARGSWTDLVYTTGPDGKTTDQLPWAIRGYMSWFDCSRVMPNQNWMELCGAIGETNYGIGSYSTITASGNGFITLFANDVSGVFYWNNSGSLNVTIERTY